MDKTRVLSGNVLKIIGAIFMVIDHIGVMFFPAKAIFRILGRLSFPIFAFLIAEGARYTKNKVKYLGLLLGFSLVIQLVYYIYDNSLRLCILVTFSLSVILIYALQYFKKQIFKEKFSYLTLLLSAFIFLGLATGIYFFCEYFFVDYSFAGVLVPVIVSTFHFDEGVTGKIKKLDNHYVSLVMLIIGLLILFLSLKWYQLYALLSIPILFFYSGKRGKYKMKYFFYFFYPLHLLALEGIRLLLI